MGVVNMRGFVGDRGGRDTYRNNTLKRAVKKVEIHEDVVEGE